MYVGECTWFWNMRILLGLRHWHGGMSFISTVWLQPHFTTTHIWSGNNPYRISASVCTELKKCDYNHICHFGQMGSTSKKLLKKFRFLISLTILQLTIWNRKFLFIRRKYQIFFTLEQLKKQTFVWFNWLYFTLLIWCSMNEWMTMEGGLYQ